MTTARSDIDRVPEYSAIPLPTSSPSNIELFLTETSRRLAAVGVVLLTAGVILGLKADLAEMGGRALVGALALSQVALAAGLGSRIAARRQGRQAPRGPLIFAVTLMGIVTIMLVADRFGYLKRLGDSLFAQIEKKDPEPPRRSRMPRH
jgi:hypothetical protein